MRPLFTPLLGVFLSPNYFIHVQAASPPPSTHSSFADVAKANGAGQYAMNFNSGAGGGPNSGGGKTAWVPTDGAAPPSFQKALHLMARQGSPSNQYLYQMSPNLVDSTAMRSLTGSIVQTFDTQDANLDGRPQVFLSHGERDSFASTGNYSQSLRRRSLCTTTSPIHLFSGMGNNVTILKADIPFNEGIMHITSGFFTIPGTLSDSLNLNPETTTFASYLASNSSIDSTPTITVFAPNNAAFLTTLSSNQTLSASNISSLIDAHVVEGFAAYSPYLINGALFRTVEGVDVSISTADDGSIFINGDASIVTEDIVIANGVVHVIDKLLFNVPSATAPTPTVPSAVFTGAAGWSAIGQKQRGWMGGVVWSIFVSVAVAVGGAVFMGI